MIFCKYCKYLKGDNILLNECVYKDNLGGVINYYEKGKIYIDKPYLINKNNDCKWFKKREIKK